MSRMEILNSKPETEDSKPVNAEESANQAQERSWSLLYTLVLAELAALVLLFYVFTRIFE